MVNVDIHHPAGRFTGEQADVLRLAIEVCRQIRLRQAHLRPTGKAGVLALVRDRDHRPASAGVLGCRFQSSHDYTPVGCAIADSIWTASGPNSRRAYPWKMAARVRP